MGDFLTFKRMLVPLLIEVVFIGGTAACLVAGILMLVSRDGMAKMAGLGVMLGGPLVLRIALEPVVVLFAIQETLVDIRDALSTKGP